MGQSSVSEMITLCQFLAEQHRIELYGISAHDTLVSTIIYLIGCLPIIDGWHVPYKSHKATHLSRQPQLYYYPCRTLLFFSRLTLLPLTTIAPVWQLVTHCTDQYNAHYCVYIDYIIRNLIK